MKIRQYLIAGGNLTALVENCPPEQRLNTSTQLLKDGIEQVGFINTSGHLPSLDMMGGELCINATVAFAAQLLGTGHLLTSGLDSVISFTNVNPMTEIEFPADYTKIENVVLFPGIGFKCTHDNHPPNMSQLQELCKKYSLPAFGIIEYHDGNITPYVYVQQTGSLVKETACGSGSIAASLVYGQSEIIQPTGQTINVVATSQTIRLSAEVISIKSVERHI